MKLEDIAKEKWHTFSHYKGQVLFDVRGYEAVLAAAAPELRALLLDSDIPRSHQERKVWRDKRDALIARLRQEVEG